ncbi:hypothetical protein [Streptomyces fradiae]|uniref:hypothetical protein n=1 Tax=Streptomyces fradiae TaxID=1906 RepID=UPI0035BE6E60
MSISEYDGAPEPSEERAELTRTMRGLPLRERLIRSAALADRSTLGIAPEDGKAAQHIRSGALKLAAYDAEHGTATGPVQPASLTAHSALPELRAYIRQEYAAYRQAESQRAGRAPLA